MVYQRDQTVIIFDSERIVIRKWFLLIALLIGLVASGFYTVQAVQPPPDQPAPPDHRQIAFCDPCEFTPPDPDMPSESRGLTTLPNPALGHTIRGTDENPLAVFSRRPLDKYIIPEGGLYLDPLHDDPHYGIDYANPDDYLIGQPTYFYPIAPGYVTARSACVMCFADSDWQGRVDSKAAQYNFGWGALVLVETPYNADVSIYVMYAHLNRDFVSLGDYITPDESIGVVGTSGYSEEMHLHMEIRYGEPGRFWNADFSQPETLDRWLSTLFVNPAFLIFPENHWAFVIELDEWAARQPTATSPSP
jgi:murein DD-endopeptidase MepM/ murein hydrolase activator NlpD